MQQLSIKFTIETLEDFHIGDGFGSIGLYDDGQLKDENGMPDFHSDTLKGLLKQSGREICKIYKGEFEDVFRLVYNYDQLNSVDLCITNSSQIDQPLVIHSFTAIEHGKRKAKGTTLRTLEFGSTGNYFDVELNFTVIDDALAESINRFLNLSIRHIKAIGKGRRRGSGLVHCKIDKSEMIPITPHEITFPKDVRCLGFILELEADTTVSESAQTGNLIRTLDHIPGPMALGMFRSPLVQRKKWDMQYLDDDHCQVSNIYPLPPDLPPDSWREIMPVPMSLRRRKASARYSKDTKFSKIPPWASVTTAGNTIDAVVTRDTLLPEAGSGGQAFDDKSLSEGYVLVDRGNIGKSIFYKVGVQTILRNQIDEKNQTTLEDSLFLQEVIPEGTKLMGIITFSTAELCAAFLYDYSPWLEGKIPFRVGRGGKPARVIKPFALTEDVSVQEQECITISCLSDAICFDERLRPVKSITGEFVAKQAGVATETVETVNALTSMRTIHSYSGMSGIRRFSDRAIAKGSCFAFTISSNATEEDRNKIKNMLALWSRDGIGFRTNEGFGKIAVNHPIHFHKVKGDSETGQDLMLAASVQERDKRRAEKNASLIFNQNEYVNIIKKLQGKQKKKTLSKSQLGRFISILESNIELKKFKTIIDDLKDNTSSKEQMTAFGEFLKQNTAAIDENNNEFRQELSLALRSMRMEG